MARYYANRMGRFVSVDPDDELSLEAPGTLNRYVYVANDPINFVDPDGETITVPGITSSSTPTCLGRLFDNMGVPDNASAGQMQSALQGFLNSSAGVMGIGMFFEVRPNGYPTNPNDGDYQAALGVGFVYINRYMSNWGYALQNRSLITAIQQASTPIFSNRNGDPALFSKYNQALTNVLNGGANTGDCNGLMFSFDLSRSILDYVFDNGRYHSQRLAGRDLQVYNPVDNALYFHSFKSSAPVKTWPGKPYHVKTINFSGGRRFHFFALPAWGGYPQSVR
jgi:hypothetical protein